jgi:hypothetical protein
MPRLIAAAALLLAFLPSAALAEVGCAPNCDFTHYYGPYDFTWVRPGLYRYALCGPSGYCLPYLVRTSRYRGSVTIRSLARPLRRPPP